jgi:hypothetical protein
MRPYMSILDIHEMDGYREGGIVVWNCPVCGRKVSVIPGVGNVILEKGDQNVEHTRSLTLTAVLEERAHDPFARWSEKMGITFDSEDDSDE